MWYEYETQQIPYIVVFYKQSMNFNVLTWLKQLKLFINQLVEIVFISY